MGNTKNIETPGKLYEYFGKYRADAKKSPKRENFYSSKLDKQVSVDREIPLTWVGFDVWLRKNKIIAKIEDYKANTNDKYSEFSDIIRAINDEIYNDKFNGAVAGIYQHNIIARDLGLVEKSETDITTKGESIKVIRPKKDAD